MTFTYGASIDEPRDVVRSLLHDIDPSKQQFQDEELDLYLAIEGGNAFEAAADAADGKAAQFSRMMDKRVGSLSLSYSQMSKGWRDLAESLRNRAITVGISGGIYAGGISKADKSTQEGDSDRVPPAFTKTQFEVPSVYPYRGGTLSPPYE